MVSATYVSGTSFAVDGDKTEEFIAGIRVRADCGADGVRLCTVVSASYSNPSSIVTVSGDALTSNLTGVLHGNDVPSSLCNHASQHMAGARDALAPADIGAMPADARVDATAPLTGGGDLWGNLTLGVDEATATSQGVVELATVEETGARSDAGRAVTPASLTAFALVQDVRITGDHAAASNTRIRGYMSAVAWITLPASPADGDTVEYVDAGRNAASYNATIQGNGKTIHGTSEDLAIDIDGLRAFFQYDATAGDWIMTLSKVGG